MRADVAKWVLFLSLAVSIPSGAAAQEATFTGTITDQTGAVLPGVTVTAIHDTSGNIFVAVTDGRGEFRLPVRVGNYRMSAELSGFTTVMRTAQILIGQTTEVIAVLHSAIRR